MTSWGIWGTIPLVRYLASMLLLLTFAATGSGALARLHELAHARQDCQHGGSHDDEGRDPAQPSHDEANCDLHALLRAPVMAGTTVPVLILLGLFAAFLTQLAPRLHGQRVPTRVDCRGPPIL